MTQQLFTPTLFVITLLKFHKHFVAGISIEKRNEKDRMISYIYI